MAEQVLEQPKAFDPIAHITARNEAEQAQRSGKPVGPVKVDAVDTEPAKPVPGIPEEPVKPEAPRLSRSQRREQNRLREEIGMLKGRLQAFEEMGIKPKQAEVKAADDPEPQLAQFGSEAEYNRALGRWDARQEAKTVLGKKDEAEKSTKELETYRDHLKAMDAKATEDMKLLPDWDEVSKSAQGDDAVEFVPDDHPTLMGLIASSDIKAFVLYHFAKHQDELQKILDLTKTPGEQIRAFARLEGRIEKLYTAKELEKQEPAQGSDKSKDESKDRKHPAEAITAGRTAADRDISKPRPSTEVAARGGSAPPNEPTVGSKEWMANRNRAQYAR